MSAGLLSFISVFLISAAYADYAKLTRLSGESDEAFVSRTTHHRVINKQLLRTKKLVPGKDSLVAFTESDAPDPTNAPDDHDLVLNFFTSKGEDYLWYRAPACEIEGGQATLRSFFLVRASARAQLDIAVICGWDATHRGADCASNDEVRFFRIPRGDNGKIEEITDKKFDIFYRKAKPSKDSDYECTYSSFSNAADVKRLLEKAGYHQGLN